MGLGLEKKDNDTDLVKDVKAEQSDVLSAVAETLPKVEAAKDDLAETLSETSEGESSAGEGTGTKGETDKSETDKGETDKSKAPTVAEQKKAQAEGAPIPETEIEMNSKISNMQNSSFGKAVAKGSKLKDVVEKSLAKRGFNAASDLASSKSGIIGATSGAGFAAKSVYDVAQTAMEGKNADAPTDKLASATDIVTQWGTSLLLSVLSIVKVYGIIKSNNSTSNKILKALPSLLSVLCNIAEGCIVSAAKSTHASKNALNFLIPAKTFLKMLDCVGDHVGVVQRQKKLESMKAKGTLDESKMKPVIEKLKGTAGEFLPNILSLGAKNIAELGYAISYAKDPASTTTLALKMASQAASGVQSLVSVKNSHAAENLKGPDQSHKDLSSNLYNEFTALYTNSDVFLGTTDEPITLATYEKKEAALQAYETVEGELDATGVAFYDLAESDDREAQQKIISSAVGY